jgi:hypothetical protein
MGQAARGREIGFFEEASARPQQLSKRKGIWIEKNKRSSG